VLIRHACVLIRHACVLIESTRTAAHESYRGACQINTGFFTVYNLTRPTGYGYQIFKHAEQRFSKKKCNYGSNFLYLSKINLLLGVYTGQKNSFRFLNF
jgi:hypothetical protein